MPFSFGVPHRLPEVQSEGIATALADQRLWLDLILRRRRLEQRRVFRVAAVHEPATKLVKAFEVFPRARQVVVRGRAESRILLSLSYETHHVLDRSPAN